MVFLSHFYPHSYGLLWVSISVPGSHFLGKLVLMRMSYLLAVLGQKIIQTFTVIGRLMPPHKDAHILILRSCEYVTLHGKRNGMGRLSWDGKITLDFLSERNLITWDLPSVIENLFYLGSEGDVTMEERTRETAAWEVLSSMSLALVKDEGATSQTMPEFPRSCKKQERRFFPRASRKRHSLVRLQSDFWPSELWDNTCVCVCSSH